MTAVAVRSTRVALAPAPAGGPCPRPGRWILDAGRSTLQVSVKVGGLATVRGRFVDLRGTLDLAADHSRSAVTVEVATASLTSGSGHWDTVLMNAGLIDAAHNPTIAFASTGLRPEADGWLLDGALLTDSGVLALTLRLVLGTAPAADRLMFHATGTVAARDAVRLLSRPGLDRLIGRSLTLDLDVQAVYQG